MISLALLLLGAASDGTPFPGSDGIYKACLAPEKSVGRAYCLGFIDATLEADAVEKYSAVCAPATTTRQQFYDAAIGYLKTHPYKPVYSKNAVVIYALAVAYPCPVRAPSFN